ncbi:anti-sigma factor antagonist [Streptomyces sp. NPDC059166]|uniref:anti-sigma factor antagonist n=1 Tax=Streptomyces sp. NPDC059166 TaxID=3346752 RepID=UPI0036837D2D
MSSTAAENPDLEVVTTWHDTPPAYVIALRGDAEPLTHDRLEDAFAQVRRSRLDLVVDLSETAFGDELLLGLLLAARGAAPSHTVVLVGPICESFQRRLDVTGAARIFAAYGSRVAALDRLAR